MNRGDIRDLYVMATPVGPGAVVAIKTDTLLRLLNERQRLINVAYLALSLAEELEDFHALNPKLREHIRETLTYVGEEAK